MPSEQLLSPGHPESSVNPSAAFTVLPSRGPPSQSNFISQPGNNPLTQAQASFFIKGLI